MSAAFAVFGARAGHAHALNVIVERFDGAADASIDEVRAAPDARFVGGTYAAITPNDEHAVWYRIRLADATPFDEQRMLSIFDPEGLEVEAFVPPAYVGVTHDIYRHAPRSGFTRHALPIELPEKLSATDAIFLKVAAEKPLPHRIEVREIVDARAADLVRARMDVAFAAIQAATVMVILCFLLVLRERVYAYFVGLMVCFVAYTLYASGLGYEIPPFDILLPLGARPTWIAAALATALLIEFTRHFLDLRRSAPRLQRVIALFRWPLGLLALCAMLPTFSPAWWIEEALALLLVMLGPMLIVASIVAWRHRSRGSGYYLSAWVPVIVLGTMRGFLLVQHRPQPEWLEFAIPAALAYASLVLAIGLAEDTLSIRHERDAAHRLAERDALTGLLNRRAILARLRAAFVHARESGEPLSLLFIDIDHFKQINDSYGHHTGDRCLRAVIAPIASELRQGDALGRYGGEEFLVVLTGAGGTNAEIVAERIRSRVENMPILVASQRIDLTLSIGVAAMDGDSLSPDQLIERADAALYRAKSSGRNLVVRYAAAPRLAAVQDN